MQANPTEHPLHRPGHPARAGLSPLRARSIAVALLSTWLVAAPVSATAADDHGESVVIDGEARVRARLVFDRPAVARAEEFRVGVHFTLDPDWHIYWRNPGDTGIATEVSWRAPHATIGDLRWPAPEVFEEAGLFTIYGYEGEVLLFASAQASNSAGSSIHVTATARFLACRVQCVPGVIELSRKLDVTRDRATDETDAISSRARVLDSLDARLFERAAAREPRPASELGLSTELLIDRSALRVSDEFEAAIALPHCPSGFEAGCSGSGQARAAFFPYALPGLEIHSTGTRAHPTSRDGFVVELAGTAYGAFPAGESRLRGVLPIRPRDGGRTVYAEIDLPLPTAAAAAPVSLLGTPWRDAPTQTLKTAAAAPTGSKAAAAATSETSAGRWLRLLVLAFMGGLVLNLMPCVLPVLAIKVFALTELAHGSRRAAMAQSGAYTAGVVASMLLLATVVTALRSAGHAVGWGFQFQQPAFVAVVSVVLVVFALNLMGVFEITFGGGRLNDIGQDASGARRSFFEGLLAVVLATPCSAPFLATATGFAFASGSLAIFAIFALIGLGLAAPFALVALIPGAARILPRPGAWMIQLRAGLGFAVLATVVWLLWVAGRSVGSDAVAALLALLVGVSFASWIFGVLQRGGHLRLARSAALCFGSVAMIALAALPLDPQAAPAPNSARGVLAGEAFDRQQIDAALSAGESVFAYFTADWCITCKVNERRVLRHEGVQAALRDGGYRVYRGDWTRRDEAIRRELAQHGRAGVPLYLVYRPDRPQPVVLPELLSVDGTIAALRGNSEAR